MTPPYFVSVAGPQFLPRSWQVEGQLPPESSLMPPPVPALASPVFPPAAALPSREASPLVPPFPNPVSSFLLPQLQAPTENPTTTKKIARNFFIARAPDSK